MGISEVMYSYGLSVISIALVFLLAYLQLKINKSEIRQWCILILACSLITNISIMFQIVNISNDASRIWYEAFALIGIAIMPVCCFFAVCYFIDDKFKFSKKHLFLFVIPILSIIATWTNDFHHLMFEKFSNNFVMRDYGILFYIMFIYLCITYTLVLIYILRYLSKNIQKYKYQLVQSLAFMIVPVIIMVLGNLKILDIKSYSNGVIQSVISIILIEILLKYQILTIIPISLINVLNAISDGFIVINKKGKIIAYNKIFINLFELEQLDILKMNIKDLLDFKEFDTLNEEDIDNIIKIKDNKEKITFERSSDKLKLYLKYEGVSLENTNNKLFLISVMDITGDSRDIQSIKLNKDAILNRERLISLGQMIGGIAHNLKTPIFSIAGALEGIEDLVLEYKDSISDETVTIDDHKEIATDMYRWTSKIQGYLSYMTDIVTAIQMQTSVGQINSDEIFTIKELLKYINILMKYELKQNNVNLKIELEIDENTKIVGNINSLVQVLNNLISNSIQAYSLKENKDKKINLKIFENTNNIYIEITDLAGGFSEDIQNKLFKEMVTTKGKKGSGLGLFISYTSIKTGFGGNLCFNTQERSWKHI